MSPCEPFKFVSNDCSTDNLRGFWARSRSQGAVRLCHEQSWVFRRISFKFSISVCRSSRRVANLAGIPCAGDIRMSTTI